MLRNSSQNMNTYRYVCVCVCVTCVYIMKWSWSEVLVAQSYPALCSLMNYHPPGSSVHGILQARILEWVAIPFSRGCSQHRSNLNLPHCRQILYRLYYLYIVYTCNYFMHIMIYVYIIIYIYFYQSLAKRNSYSHFK